MSGDEPRRSGRANKGHHKRGSSSPAPTPVPEAKPTKPAPKKGRKSTRQTEPEEEEEEGAEVIRCICGDDNANDKRAFIGCDACSVWQHNVCMGMPDDEDEVGEHYFCEECRPEEHQETLEALKRGDKIWETRTKLYNAEKKKSKGRKSKSGDEKQPWLKRELRASVEPEATPEAPEPKESNKRKRGAKEEPEEPEAKPEKPTRQEKRRKAEPKASSPDPDTALVSIDKLPANRQKIAQALSALLLSDFKARDKASNLKLKDGETAASLADSYAARIEYSMHMNHGSQAPGYGAQWRALSANLKKNRTLIENLLEGRLTADELSTMSSADMASEELQKERAAMKAEADRLATIEQVDQGPRYRRTHKGDEIVESEGAASSSAPVSRPVRQSISEADGAITAGSPTAASPTVKQAGDAKGEDRRASNPNFDMQDIWAKTGQSAPPPRPLQIPARQRSMQGAEDGTKVDADVDRLLADDDETYSPQEFPGDIVWRGKVISTTGDAAPMVNARWVAGRDISQTLPWRELLPDKLNIDGRLQIPKAEEYLCGLQWSSSSDVSVLALTPFDDAAAFNNVFQYFKSRDRYAVVNKDKPSALFVKDLYIIPVEVGDKLPDHIEMLEHCTLAKPAEERLLLATFVVARSTADNQIAAPVQATQPTNGHRDRILSAQGPAASPINASGPTFASSTQSPGQQGYAPAPALPLGHDEKMRIAYEMLGHAVQSPVAQQVLNAPGVTMDVLQNMRKIFDEDPITQRDMTAFAAKLGYRS